MLSVAKHLCAQRDRPFAAAQGDKDRPVMLSLYVALRVNSAKYLCAERDRPFAAAQGDMVKI